MSMIGTMMYTMMTSLDQMQSIFTAQSEKQILDIAEAVAINKLKPIGQNQTLVAEFGVKGEAHQEIPSSWGIQSVNSYGNKLIYCPIGQPISGPAGSLESDSVKTGPFDEYQVRLKPYFNGEKYVVESEFNENSSYAGRGVIAFIISPQSSTGITCSSVYLESTGNYEKFKIEGSHGRGRVAAITKDLVISYKANQPIVIKSADNENADFKSLTDYWQSINPLRFSIIMTNNNALPLGDDSVLMKNEFPGSNQEILIKGDGEKRTIHSDSFKSITFENSSVVLENINITGQVKLSFINSDVLIRNVGIEGEMTAIDSNITYEDVNIQNGTKLTNSKITSRGVNSFGKTFNQEWSDSVAALELVNSDYSDIGSSQIKSTVSGLSSLLANNSRVRLNSSNFSATVSPHSPGAIMLTNGSELTSSSSTISLINNETSAQSMFTMDESSRASSTSSLYRTSGAISVVFNLYGDMSFVGSEVRTGSSVEKIISINGLSKLNLSRNTVIGSGSGGLVGVSSENGNTIGGANAHIHATSCLAGETENKSSWQCN